MLIEHESGFRILIPDDWHVETDPSEAIAVAALAPPDVSGFSRNIVVTSGPLTPDWPEPAAWQRTAAEALANALHDAQLIDRDVEQRGFRHLISYATEDRAMCLEQWAQFIEVPGEGEESRAIAVTVSATTPALVFADHAEEMNGIAWSLGPSELGSA